MDDNDAARRGDIISDITELDVMSGVDMGCAAIRPEDSSIGIAVTASISAGALSERTVREKVASDTFASDRGGLDTKPEAKAVSPANASAEMKNFFILLLEFS